MAVTLGWYAGPKITCSSLVLFFLMLSYDPVMNDAFSRYKFRFRCVIFNNISLWSTLEFPCWVSHTSNLPLNNNSHSITTCQYKSKRPILLSYITTMIFLYLGGNSSTCKFDWRILVSSLLSGKRQDLLYFDILKFPFNKASSWNRSKG